MNITADLIFDLLSANHKVERHGQDLKNMRFTFPMLFRQDDEQKKGAIYVTRAQDLLVDSDVECLFVCLGKSPNYLRRNWKGEVFFLEEGSLDLLSLFNEVQGIYEKLFTWFYTMQSLLASGGELKEFVSASIPIFENRITITDYSLKVIAYCEGIDTTNGRCIVMSDRYAYIPQEKTALFGNTKIDFQKQRGPFFYEETVEGVEYVSYCVNLYLSGGYAGTCALREDYRPLRGSDLVLFQTFSEFIHTSLSLQLKATNEGFVTLKGILADLLNSFPVSESIMKEASQIQEKSFGSGGNNAGNWCCVVIKSYNRGRTLPAEYLCSSIENIIPYSTAIDYEDQIVAFCRTDRDIDVSAVLTPWLRDMSLRAGISVIFEDIFKARRYYLQAFKVLETGVENDHLQPVFHFAEVALQYALKYCSGEFEPKMMLTPGMHELRRGESSVDYWETLRIYLDNNSNASKTAHEMFLHRSTMLLRLERIKSNVPLDTPEQRLYAHICTHLKL